MIRWFSLRPVQYPHRGMAQVGNCERMQMDGWAGWNAWEGRTLQLHVSCISTCFYLRQIRNSHRFMGSISTLFVSDSMDLAGAWRGGRWRWNGWSLMGKSEFFLCFLGVQETFGIHQGLQRQRGCGEYGRLKPSRLILKLIGMRWDIL